MDTTIINIKTEKKLKDSAKKLARSLGLPLSAVVNSYLREFVRERRITFSEPPVPNVRTRKVLDEALADITKGENVAGPFKSADEMMKSLRSEK